MNFKKLFFLIFKLNKLRNTLFFHNGSFFVYFYKYVITKKLHLLGLIDTINDFKKNPITLNCFKKRMLKNILVNNHLTDSVKKALYLIKKKKFLLTLNWFYILIYYLLEN
ncbi:hypothetical protein CPARA_1gp169 (nucleomorph) [Cryptomonas paramecium]|uniref:Uncharacterized protein n=1 Tax=Cryptomonas paramaecium TaxID=2898 RepID=F2HHN1_9CRYP|nr:hypothetical protein CPARA_1gp169 [Cryptomonas paramecium]AEA38827.1 hypothetical protein CPARA_1gp169 [Cryptomonas paramecium]